MEETIWNVHLLTLHGFGKLTFGSNPGPLMYLAVGGQGILVLNTHRVAADLLDRRGHIYSDRPRMISKSSRPSPAITHR